MSFSSDPVNVTQGLSNRTVNESSQLLVLRCLMTGFPEPKVLWTACNSSNCDPVEGNNITTSNATFLDKAKLYAVETNLSVASVLQNQQLYTCSGQNNVENFFGDEVSSSSSAFLTVQGV